MRLCRVLEAIDVWVRGEGVLYHYHCFRRLVDGRYCVQSMDFVRTNDDPGRRAELERQFVELLAETDPTARSPSFASLPEAIKAWDAEFGNSEPSP
ncbi:MAG: hypothetical protein M3256_16630 [Actinomycetota bacterium]|nr:hypothetical protein [Actinomycetota bacterium]